MKRKAWDAHKVCRHCGVTRTKNQHCAKCTTDLRKQKHELEAARFVAADLVKLKARCGQLGLYRTMHLLEAAVTQVGWEIGEKVR